MDRKTPETEPAPESVPRRRGDGPLFGRVLAMTIPCSPQARGWTDIICMQKYANKVFPAGAGMDRCCSCWARPWSCVPRRRGDGPTLGDTAAAMGKCSPQARGWTATAMTVPVGRPVFPAGAGMDRTAAPSCSRTTGVPRRRGDGPLKSRLHYLWAECSPQARGWTGGFAIPHGHDTVFPAGAGMDRGVGHGQSKNASVPRRRGDGPSHWPHKRTRRKCSPQARGWTDFQ